MNSGIALALAALLIPAVAFADPVWAIRPEPGLVCMSTTPLAPILEQPQVDAHPIATAGPVVFVLRPVRVENGFIEIERPNKQAGWIAQNGLHQNLDHCQPTLMSSGLILPTTH